eukprot:4738845-Prymnesium_polylepis.1
MRILRENGDLCASVYHPLLYLQDDSCAFPARGVLERDGAVGCGRHEAALDAPSHAKLVRLPEGGGECTAGYTAIHPGGERELPHLDNGAVDHVDSCRVGVAVAQLQKPLQEFFRGGGAAECAPLLQPGRTSPSIAAAMAGDHP